MKCFRCDGENQTNANYCEYCGAKLFNKCPQCGNSNILRKKYCPSCGVNLESLFSLIIDKDLSRDAFQALDLDAELEIYKRELKKGSTVITCPHCSVKNRLPKDKIRNKPKCGSCGKLLVERKYS